MRKAVFLDRDGTINVDKNYLYKIEDFEFFPRAVEALQLLQSSEYLLIIITNQSGIARGYFTENDFIRLNDFMLNELEKLGVHISKSYYCPHGPNSKCNCRKPKTGLFEQAVKEYNIDLSKSFAIGDKLRDCSICLTTKCRGFIINGKSNNENIKSVSNLFEAAKIITGSGKI